MAFDAFMKIDGIPGESTDDKHRGEIDVLSFSFGVSNPTQVGGGTAGGTTSDVQDFSIVKFFDLASPKLFLAACAGQPISQAVFTARNGAGKNAAEFLKITMSHILVSNINPGGSAGGQTDRPTETVSFNFSKIEIQYTPLTQKGTAGTPVTVECGGKHGT
jgi:type VI secretion system secreted protein Hcp